MTVVIIKTTYRLSLNALTNCLVVIVELALKLPERPNTARSLWNLLNNKQGVQKYIMRALKNIAAMDWLARVGIWIRKKQLEPFWRELEASIGSESKEQFCQSQHQQHRHQFQRPNTHHHLE